MSRECKMEVMAVPHKWFVTMDESCEGRDEYGRVEIERYLTHLREDPACTCDWTFPVVNYFIQVERDYLSPTTLQRCAREVFLRHATDYAVDPAKAWARARGTISHSGLEKYSEGLTEVVLQRSIEVDGVQYVIKGRADNIIPERGLIRDWKTTGSISRLLKMGELPKAEHQEQLSVYGWMAAGNTHIDDETIHRIDNLTKGEVVYIDAYGMKRLQFDLWPHDQVEEIIRVRLPLIARMMELGMAVDQWRQGDRSGPSPDTSAIAPVLPDGDQWKCDYCDVRDQCTMLALREGQEPPHGRRSRKDEIVSNTDGNEKAKRSRKQVDKEVDTTVRTTVVGHNSGNGPRRGRRVGRSKLLLGS